MLNTIDGTVSELASERFVFGSAADVLGVDLTAHDEWRVFQTFFDMLEPDRYMNDGGKYRLRRFGRYRYVASTDDLVLEPHRPYSQPKYFNPLNGDVQRHFAPLCSPILTNGVLSSLLVSLGKAFSSLEEQSRWRINAYFNRIVASAREAGKPVPEGPHRDGVKFSCLFMANRIRFEGGETSLLDLITHKPVFRGALRKPGDMLVFRDDTVLHDTTPIHPTDPAREGYRDVLVIEFH